MTVVTGGPGAFQLHKLEDLSPGRNLWGCSACDWVANWDYYSTESAAEEAFSEYHRRMYPTEAGRKEERVQRSWEQYTRQHDPVNHPSHYTSHPSGVECITVVEHMGFCLGNAIKYIWRADEKGNDLQDLEKARWYLDREIQRRKKLQ